MPSSFRALMAWLPRVIELARLADLEGAAAEDEDFLGGSVRASAALPFHFRLSEELIEQKLRVGRPGRGFGMELDAHERPGRVADALVRSVVGVREPGLPGLGQAADVHGETVVLAGDVAAPRPFLEAGLVLAAVAELELVGVRRRRPGPGSGCRGRCRRSGRSPASGGGPRRSSPRTAWDRPGRWR